MEAKYPMDALLTQRRRLLAGIGALGAVAMTGCGRTERDTRAEHLSFSGTAMGSSWHARAAAGQHEVTELHAAVQRALDAVEGRMSLFRADSELVRFNRAAGVVDVSPELHAVLSAATDVSRWSDGAFDVTVAPLVEAWGFGTRAVRQVPSAAQIADGRSTVDWRALVPAADGTHIVKRAAAVQADLGGIAKGHAVDCAAAALDALGVSHYMVEAGGEVRARGLNAEGRPWRIGIEEPDSAAQRARWVVPLTDRAMATSGDYRNFYMQDGVRYSHEIDARSGAPIRHSLCSVTVVAEDCMRADALATALIVMGPERGVALATRDGIAAQFILRDAQGRFADAMTPAFAALGAQRA